MRLPDHFTSKCTACSEPLPAGYTDCGRAEEATENGTVEAAVAAAIAKERADIRSWLGQQAARTKRGPSASLTNHAIGKGDAFKEAADYLKPPRKPSAKLVEKRAKRKAVAK